MTQRPTTFDQLLANGKVLVADGGMGTSLFGLGLANGESPELLNVIDPDMVVKAHRGFVEAGSDIILTNTFGGTRRRLALHQLQDRVGELNSAAVAVAREAAAFGERPVAIAGSIGPTGDLIQPLGELSFDDAVAAFKEQAEALDAAGVDVLWIETMSSIEELSAALAATDGIDLPVVTTMSFDTNGCTMMGIAPSRLATWSHDRARPPAAVGANCGIGPGDVLAAVHDIIAASPETVVIAKANAGIPAYTKAGGLTYPTAAVDMVDYAKLAVGLRARIIGACCGSTPDHIASIRKVVDELEPGRTVTALADVEARFGTSAPAKAPTRERRARRRSANRTA
jgi:5-methyltetrahydrofolate--homocysteine methyltransferase